MEYDLSNPVNFYTHIGGTNTLRELFGLVFEPGLNILREFAATSPQRMVAFHDQEYRKIMSCDNNYLEIVTLYTIDHKSCVVLIGYVLALNQARERLEQAIDDCRAESNQCLRTLTLKKAASLCLTDRFVGRTLGTSAKILTQKVIEDGLRRYLDRLCAPLRHLPVGWLANAETVRLEEKIDDLVDQSDAYLGIGRKMRRARREADLREARGL